MANSKSPDRKEKKPILGWAEAFGREITKPAANVEPVQQPRIRLISAFFIFVVFSTLGAALLLRNNEITLSNILLAFCAVLAACYLTSRSQYYRAAILMAVVVPAVPPIIIAMFQPAGVPLEAVLMWLALPLLAAGMVLRLWQAGIVMAAYIVAAIGLGFSGVLALNGLIALIIFFLAVTFFMVSFSEIRKKGRALIKNQIEERQNVTKNLKESEETFFKTFQSSPVCMSIASYGEGKFTAVNESFVRTMGYTREELLGHTADEFGMWTNPKHRDKLMNYIRLNKQLRNEELDFRHKNGEIRNMLVSTEYIQIGGQSLFLMAGMDITDYKLTQKALNKTGEQLDKIFRLSPQQILVTRVKDGKFIEINEAFTRVTGYAREEIIGKTAIELESWVNPENRNLMLQRVKREGRVDNMEVELRIKSGEIITELLSAELLNHNGEECLITVLTNITDRKKMEQALKGSEEKFSKVFQAIPEDIAITRVKDSTFVDVNEGFCRQTKHTREEIIGHTGAEIGLPEVPSHPETLIDTIREEGEIFNRELVFYPQTDKMIATLFSARIINIAGEPCMLSFSTDITERKKMEESLANEAIRRRILIEQSSDGIVILNQNGTVYEANRRFAEMLGYTAEEIKKIEVRDWELLASQEIIIQQLLATDEEGDHFETRHRRKDGSIFDVEISTNGAVFAGKKLIFCVCRDITQRKKMEKAIQESEEKFSKAFQAIPESVFISTLEEGRFVEVNANFCQATGHTHTEIIGHTSEELQLSARPQSRDVLVKRLLEQGKIVNEEVIVGENTENYEARLFSADIIEVGGVPCMIGMSNDITKIKRMEKAIKESEEKFSKAFQSIPESVAISTLEDGIFVDVNENFCRSVGRTHDEIIGHTAEELRLLGRPDQRDQMLTTLKKHGRIKNTEIVSGENTGNYEARLFSADIIEIGGVPCMISVSNDITERKKIERALQESEEKFSKAFHSIPESVSISRVKDGVFIDVNENFCRSIGHTHDEIIGHTGEEMITTGMPGNRNKIIQTINEKGSISNLEYSHYLPTGETGTMLFSADIIDIGGEPCMISISNDITERKHMERALKESEGKFSKIFRMTPQMVIITRMKDGTSREILDVNESFSRRTGFTREDVMGKTTAEIGFWKSLAERDKTLLEIKEKGRVTNHELEYFTKSGEVHTALISAERIEINGQECLISIIVDITERKRMEKALQESEEKFSKIFRLSPLQIIISRLYQDKMPMTIEVNESLLELSGYTREELIGKTINELNIWKNPADSVHTLKTVLEQGRMRNYEFDFYLKSGEIHTGLLSSEAMVINGENCAISMITDITERKQSEEQLKMAMLELKLSSAQLKATNKELESFSYSVSHDLRAPLRSIDGFSQALLEDYAPLLDETARDYLNRMRNASQKMGELIDGILNLSRLTRGDMHRETVDLSKMAQEIYQRLHETNPDRVVQFVAEKDLKVNGDPQMLRSLMENLVGNAWKFTQKVPEARIEFGRTIIKDKKTYFIKDNGAGFDMAYADKLFGAFQRLHSTADYPGTGIGLATVQRIINRHGGSIRAEGAVDRGAAFYFTL
jgi:PAS domain S-box-containing protein